MNDGLETERRDVRRDLRGGRQPQAVDGLSPLDELIEGAAREARPDTNGWLVSMNSPPSSTSASSSSVQRSQDDRPGSRSRRGRDPRQVVVRLPVVERPMRRQARPTSPRPGRRTWPGDTDGRSPSTRSRRRSRDAQVAPACRRSVPSSAPGSRSVGRRGLRRARQARAGAGLFLGRRCAVGAFVEVAVVGDLVAGIADRATDRRPAFRAEARNEEVAWIPRRSRLAAVGRGSCGRRTPGGS